MDPSMIDEGAAAPSLPALRQLGEEMLQLEKEILALEELLKAKNAAAANLKMKRLPEMMFNAGLSQFTMLDGVSSLKIDDFVQGNLPKEDLLKREAALVYLGELGADGIIKNTITVEFEKKQHNQALALNEELRKMGFEPVLKNDVHTGTLQAFVRECLRDGKQIEPERLGCHVGRIAKVKLPRKAKES